MRTSSREALGLGLVLMMATGLVACDKKADAQPDDGKSVADGAKPRTAVGEQVEVGKQRVNEAEAKLQARDDAIMNAGQEDNAAQRGMQP